MRRRSRRSPGGGWGRSRGRRGRSGRSSRGTGTPRRCGSAPPAATTRRRWRRAAPARRPCCSPYLVSSSMGALLAWPCSCLVVCLLFRRRFNSTIHRAAAQCRSIRDDDASEAVFACWIYEGRWTTCGGGWRARLETRRDGGACGC